MRSKRRQPRKKKTTTAFDRNKRLVESGETFRGQAASTWRRKSRPR